jgi:hypothetical protein
MTLLDWRKHGGQNGGPTNKIYLPVIGGGGELCAGSGTQEEGGCQTNTDFPKELGNADATQQNRTKWAGCSIFPTPSEAHIDQSHAQKAGDEGG